MVFDLGDTIEDQLVKVAVQYGLKDLQKECSVTIDGVVIGGTIDGILDDMIVDFKSTTTHSIKAAMRGDVGSYDRQMHFYMKALGFSKALLVYYCKETSNLHEVLIHWDDNIWNEVEERFRKVIRSTKENLPDREYGPGKTGRLPWQCSYCAYVETCWPDVKLNFDDAGKPQLFVKKEDRNDF